MIRIAVRTLALAALALAFAMPAPAQDKTVEKIEKALPEKAPAAPKAKRKVLVYSKTVGFRHDSIPIGTKTFAMMGDKTGAYTAVLTEDPSYFAPDKLKEFDAVVMLNTTGDCLRPSNDKAGKEAEEIYKKSLQEFVAGGKGLMGTHSATDTYHNWKAFNKMMGGTFDGHPWHQKIPVKNLEPKHPLNAAFDGKDFEINDEIYQFRADGGQPKERTFLLVLDTGKFDTKAGKRKDGQYPISWVSTYGKGRTFYCSLGHRQEIYTNPVILQHYLAGLQYILGDLEAPAIASPLE